MINDASAFGKVIVLLNSDAWLTRKKGYVFMPFAERKEVLESMRSVDVVLPALDEDGTVCASLADIGAFVAFFGNGGDRTTLNTPEERVCEQLGIHVVYGLGGNKIQSSSDLVKNVRTH